MDSATNCTLRGEAALWATINPEVVLAWHVITNKVKYQVFKGVWAFVRSGRGPVCDWVAKMVGGGPEERNLRFRRCEYFKETNQTELPEGRGEKVVVVE